MGKIFVGQTKLKIEATVDQAITGATATIEFKKPDGTRGNWPAVIDDDVLGIVSFSNFLADSLDMSKFWSFWAHIIFSDGREADGEATKVRIYEPGTW